MESSVSGFHGVYEITVNIPGKGSFVKTIENHPEPGVLLYTFNTQGEPIESTTYGDINRDGEINSLDLIIMKAHILGSAKISAGDFDAADLDGNGNIDSQDLVLLKRFILKKIDTFPVQS